MQRYTGNYRFAGRTVRIYSLHRYVQKLCRDYAAEGTPDFTVSTDSEDILRERRALIESGLDEQEVVEVTAVYRKIAEQLLEYDTILFHGSCIAIDGEGYLFTAASGTGKSTHTRLLREYLGERAFMVNDDKPLLQIDHDQVIAYGTPWDGKHRLSRNTSVPLKAVILLSRSEKNYIAEISSQEAWPMLIQQSYTPTQDVKMVHVLKLLNKMQNSVRLYRLECNMEPDAARVSYEGLKGLK